MFFKTVPLALAIAALLGGTTASPTPALTCVSCPPSIVFEGVTRTLTLSREETGNTLQCNYDTPAISGFSPGCLYSNNGGTLIFSNTGGACPNPATVTNCL
ncbi:hypothetical protein BDY19DRAFT_917159 [Irpex rosettiformis]|uniref:Uncharacterized protein n=1 Tax=Irpex rosettiformis TaxID=378272 RepID=A0ACB8ULL9_9APHY|nr:hypothetical protein BDY19DRAFT_917159 [Irpex rosettiformis]